MGYQVPRDLENRPVVVVGAGTLGRRIALVQATYGSEVRMVDTSTRALDEARDYIEAELPAWLSKTSGTAGTMVFSKDLTSAVQHAWLITEAVPEKLDLKQDLFADLDRLAPQDSILASNSSSYPSSQLAARVSIPERLVNTHYYMPPRLNVVEIMSCGHTDPTVIELLMHKFSTSGLVPFHVKRESVGFIFNRIWAAIKRESLALVADGVSSPEEVDRIFSLVMQVPAGPFRLMDMVGLDVVLGVEEHYATLQPDLNTAPRKLLREYTEKNWLGMKSGRGFYDYTER